MLRRIMPGASAMLWRPMRIDRLRFCAATADSESFFDFDRLGDLIPRGVCNNIAENEQLPSAADERKYGRVDA